MTSGNGLGKDYGYPEVIRSFDTHVGREAPPSPEREAPEARDRPHGIPVKQLGWTKAQVEEARRRLASVAEDWDDPDMDVYDEEP